MIQAIGVLAAMMLGAGAALQVGLLGAMSRSRGSIEASWVSVLGTVCIIAVVLGLHHVAGWPLRLPAPFDSGLVFGVIVILSGALLMLALTGLPVYFALTGSIAVPYLIGASYLAPRIGVGLFLASVISGQLLVGVILDHVGAFGAAVRPIDVARGAGVIALLVGVILIRGFR